MAERRLIGTFMGVEFYADPYVPSGTVIFENAKPSEPEVDFACGGTDTEPHSDRDAAIMQMPYLTISQEVLDIYETLFCRNKASDVLAITRSIARGS